MSNFGGFYQLRFGIGLQNCGFVEGFAIGDSYIGASADSNNPAQVEVLQSETGAWAARVRRYTPDNALVRLGCLATGVETHTTAEVLALLLATNCTASHY